MNTLANRTSPVDPPINIYYMLAFRMPRTMRVGKTFAEMDLHFADQVVRLRRRPEHSLPRMMKSVLLQPTRHLKQSLPRVLMQVYAPWFSFDRGDHEQGSVPCRRVTRQPQRHVPIASQLPAAPLQMQTAVRLRSTNVAAAWLA